MLHLNTCNEAPQNHPFTWHLSNTQWAWSMDNQYYKLENYASLYMYEFEHKVASIVQKFTPSISLSLASENSLYSEKKKNNNNR